MYEQSIMKEANKHKDSPRFKIKAIIFMYKCLKFCNGNVFYFTYSLATILLPLFIYNFSVGAILFAMLIHYILFIRILKDRINKYFNSEIEIQEIDDIIEILENHLKKKNPN